MYALFLYLSFFLLLMLFIFRVSSRESSRRVARTTVGPWLLLPSHHQANTTCMIHHRKREREREKKRARRPFSCPLWRWTLSLLYAKGKQQRKTFSYGVVGEATVCVQRAGVWTPGVFQERKRERAREKERWNWKPTEHHRLACAPLISPHHTYNTYIYGRVRSKQSQRARWRTSSLIHNLMYYLITS